MFLYLRRALLAGAAAENGSNDMAEQGHDDDWAFDPRIFWAVNTCILVAVLATCCYCSYGDRSCFTRAHERRLQTDLEYQRNLMRREERKRQAKLLTPAKRKRLLLASFKKHQVIMTVNEQDLIADPDKIARLNAHRNDPEEEHSVSSSSSSFSSHLLLQLRTGSKVSDGCAVCLGDYKAGDQVVWSSKEECGHVFHLSCLLDWFVKMQPSTPCPCCRAEFADWETIRREEKIVWTPGDTFNPNVIRLTENMRLSEVLGHR